MDWYKGDGKFKRKCSGKNQHQMQQIDCSPEDLINDILHDYLSDVEEIHDGLDAEKILAMLDHDKPEGDDVLEILSNVNKLKWTFWLLRWLSWYF